MYLKQVGNVNKKKYHLKRKTIMLNEPTQFMKHGNTSFHITFIRSNTNYKLKKFIEKRNSNPCGPQTGGGG